MTFLQRISGPKHHRNTQWPWRLIFLLLFLCSCGKQGATWERIEKSGVLRVGMDPTYPPFELDDGSQLTGLDVDLAAAVARDLELTPQYMYFGYDGLYDALATEQVDVLISALVVVPERMRDFAYSSSYFDAGEILIVPAHAAELTSMSQMSGRSVAVELGAQGHVEALNWAKRLPDLTIQPYNAPEEALNSVATAASEAALIDAVSGRLFLMSHPELKRSPEAVTMEPYAIVVRIEDEHLLQKLNERLVNLRQSGELEEIVSRWLGD